jgi:CoA:oxalate CoA-transferase
MAHLKEFLAELNAVIGTWKTLGLENHLVAAGVPCSKLNTVDQLLADGQVNALDPFNEVDDPDYGHFKVPGAPIHIHGMGKPQVRRPPRLGEHTRQVLRETGYDTARIDALIQSGAVAEGPPAKGAAAD